MRRFAIATLLMFIPLGAVEYLPWYPRNLELQWTSAYAHQYYKSVDSGGRTARHCCHGNYLLQNLEVAYAEWYGAVDLLFAESCDRNFGGDHVGGTVRYQFLDDIYGDDVSAVFGCTVAAVFSPALRDMSVFHHGRFEGDIHLLVGKELVNDWKGWQLRGWASAGVGVADHGSPWLFGEGALESKWCLAHVGRLYTVVRHGLGGNNLNLNKRFHGYGSIDYTAVDGGLRYSYQWDIYGTLSVDYSYRFYARNCPKNSQRVLIGYCYPFGL